MHEATVYIRTGDGATHLVEVSLTVQKAEASLTIDKDSGTVLSNEGTDSFSYTYTGDGAVSVISSDPSVATAEVSDTVVTVTGHKAGQAEITVHGAEGPNYKKATDAVYTLTVEEYSTPSTGGSGVTRYTVSTPSNVEGGTVKVSPTRASRGQTVTITVTPDEGYELDALTVTNSDGKAVELTDKGDGKFTFKMPRGKVEIDASFKAIEEPQPEPVELPFTDVEEGAWYYDAVSYAYENGLMTGTSATLFAPNTTTSRAMLATLLYRLEGSPDLSNEILGYPYADVEAESWYGDAVYWARLNGVVTGITAEIFNPNGDITREQMAAML